MHADIHKFEKANEIPDEGASAHNEGGLSYYYKRGKPEALPGGYPRHLFYSEKDESVLGMKLILWDGFNVIVSFEGTLSEEMKPLQPNEGVDTDVTLLAAYEVPEVMKMGQRIRLYFALFAFSRNVIWRICLLGMISSVI